MNSLDFDLVTVDPMGNLFGYIGSGRHLIAYDGHVDTVSCGNRAQWEFDPFLGFEDDDRIGGLGSTDQKGGVAAMVYAAKIIKDLGLLSDFTLLVACTVQEEDGDGLAWQYIIEQDQIKPEFVLLTEPCDDVIRHGQRGRAEMWIRTDGVAAHGSTPHLGVNAIYKMAPILAAVEKMNTEMADDGLLGHGSITISEIYSTSPSRCSVSDSCTISLDRRTNFSDSAESVLDDLRRLPEVRAAGGTVGIYQYDDPSYTGLIYPADKFYPAWIHDMNSNCCRAVAETYRRILRRKPTFATWQFSTNGVAIMGRHQIPCLGYGPGTICLAHRPNESVQKEQLLDSCALYAGLPGVYVELLA